MFLLSEESVINIISAVEEFVTYYSKENKDSPKCINIRILGLDDDLYCIVSKNLQQLRAVLQRYFDTDLNFEFEKVTYEHYVEVADVVYAGKDIYEENLLEISGNLPVIISSY